MIKMQDIKATAQVIGGFVKREAAEFLRDGGYLYIGRDWNIHVRNDVPREGEARFRPLHFKGKKEKEKQRKAQVQKQLAAFGVALKSDIERLEGSIDDIKKSLNGGRSAAKPKKTPVAAKPRRS
jgi:hypothetical protein